MKRRPQKLRGVATAVPPRTQAVLFALAAVSAILSAYLTYASYRLSREPGYQSICAINAVLDCDRVVSSAYGSLLGAPLAWYAMWFYAFFALVAWSARPGSRLTLVRSPSALLLLMGAFGVTLSIGLAAVSVLELQAVCIVCTTLYALNVALLITSWIALRESGETLSHAVVAERSWRGRRLVRLAMIAGVALMIAPLVTYRMFGGRSRFCDLAAEARQRAGGSLTITVYSDLRCPHCRVLHRQLHPLRTARDLRIIDRQYPLDPACNPRVSSKGHAGACLQARAVICARQQARDDELADRLFDENPTDSSGIVRLADSLGLDQRQFTECLTSAASSQELEQEMAAARSAGVHGTPTIVFDTGERYWGRLSDEEVACLISPAPPPGRDNRP